MLGFRYFSDSCCPTVFSIILGAKPFTTRVILLSFTMSLNLYSYLLGIIIFKTFQPVLSPYFFLPYSIADLRKKITSILASYRREKGKVRRGVRSTWFLYPYLKFLSGYLKSPHHTRTVSHLLISVHTCQTITCLYLTEPFEA